jgi:hypothetical protein
MGTVGSQGIVAMLYRVIAFPGDGWDCYLGTAIIARHCGITATREMTMRIATILISILDAAMAVFIAVLMFKSESDPATLGLDVAAGWTVTILCLLTAVPAFVLALTKKWPKTALALALAFPAAFVVLFVAVVIYFM